MVEIFPVHVSEEWLAHDFLSIRWSTSKTLLWLARQELLQNGYRVAGHVNWIERFVGENSVVDLVLIFSTERRLLKEHLIYQNTEGPPIYGTSILLVQQDLVRSVIVQY